MNDSDQRITRRRLLRSAVVGGSGLLAAYLVGCGGDEEPRVNATPAVTPTLAGPGVTGGSTPALTASPIPTTLRWDRLDIAGAAPPPRRDHSLVTDGTSIFLFGGRGASGELNDLWTYDLASGVWTEINSPNPPSARFGHNAVYSEVDSRMVIFGGQAGSQFFGDTWAFTPDADSWAESEIPGDSPAARYGAAATHDPSGRLIVSHGFTSSGRFDDTWALALFTSNWTELARKAERPVERCLVRGVWDSGANRFLIFGGQSNQAPFLGDLWSFDGASWTEIDFGDGPAPRTLYSMVYDGGSTRVMLFGGATADGATNDLWFLDTQENEWSQQSPEGDAPSPRSGHDSIWLPEARSLFVFGGRGEAGDLDEMWRLFVPFDE
ncbi:MAG: hypothetical protein IH957_05975 [Chloroflexi bacterium]|nr:hypothetical protein [Chloroflexota bacterium]